MFSHSAGLLFILLGYNVGPLCAFKVPFTTNFFEETLLLVGRISRLNIQDANLKLNYIPKNLVTDIWQQWRRLQSNDITCHVQGTVKTGKVLVMFTVFLRPRFVPFYCGQQWENNTKKGFLRGETL